MKYILSIIVSLCAFVSINAQIPFFGTTVGEKKTYTYLQWKAYPGHNSQEFYMSAKYGVTKRGDASLAYYDVAGYNVTSIGWTQNLLMHKNINIAIQPMVSFDMRNSFHFSDVTTGLYLHGNIVPKLNYYLNTWYTQYENSSSWTQWSYVGYDISKVSLLFGAVTDYSNDLKTDIAIGLWFPIRNSTYVYLWGGNLTSNLGNPKVTVGIDYKF